MARTEQSKMLDACSYGHLDAGAADVCQGLQLGLAHHRTRQCHGGTTGLDFCDVLPANPVEPALDALGLCFILRPSQGPGELFGFALSAGDVDARSYRSAAGDLGGALGALTLAGGGLSPDGEAERLARLDQCLL